MSNTRRAARTAANAGVDALLAANGKSGRILEIVSHGIPVTILTHWQSLYTDDTCAGLSSGCSNACASITVTI